MVELIIFLFFADSLYKEGDYYRAITEYKRLFFYRKLDKKELYYKIGKCYEKKGDLKKAISYYSKYFFREQEPDTNFIIRYSILLFKTGKIDEGVYLLEQSNIYTKKKKFLLSYGYLSQGNFEKYVYYLPDKNIFLNEKKWKVISLFFPGIPQIFHKRVKEGIASFLANCISAYLVYRSFKERDYFSSFLFFGFFLRFYSGNYINSSSMLRDINIERIEKKVEKIYQELLYDDFW